MKLLVITPLVAYATHRLRKEAAALGVGADFFDVKELASQNFEIDVDQYSILYVRQMYPYFKEMEKLVGEF